MSKKKRDIPLPRLPEGVKLIDTHCHLDMAAYSDDLEEVLSRSAAAGVSTIITIGIDLESSRQAVALADQHEGIYATVGIHPHNVSDLTDEHYRALRDLATHPKVVGYGEVGMDCVKGYSPVELQRQHFAKQVQLAGETELPLIVHDREAHGDVMRVLREHAPFPAGGVMHCFSGDAALAQEVMELGLYISIPGVVTFNKADDMQEAVRRIPLEALLLETDGPFLAPVPKRGKRNEPEYLLHTAAKVAELKGISLAEVAKRTTENAQRLFRLEACESMAPRVVNAARNVKVGV